VESSLNQLASDLKQDMRDRAVPFLTMEVAGRDILVGFPNTQSREKFKEIEKAYSQFKVDFAEGGDLPKIKLSLSAAEIARIKENAVDQGLETIRNRIDQFGVAEASIQRQGENQIVVQLPGIKDAGRAIELVGKTARLEFKLVDEENSLEAALKGNVPEGSEVLYQREVNRQTGEVVKTPILIKKRVLMTGEVITDAKVQIGSEYGEPQVSMTFDKLGARLFGRITEANVGRRLAIVLDGTAYSAPVIREKIPSGRAQISGRFTSEEAHDLAIVLRAGALPAPVEIQEQQVVGPSLGRDSIYYGVLSTLIAALVVVVFMVLYYDLSGMVANIALGLNLLLLLACMTAFRATLTLHGIAGIVLSLAMAVDANVLIFERIREELATNKTVKAAIDSGYHRAFTAIIDSNLTTLIAGAVLFHFGTGPIKGFAVTLSIGLVVSMFTAIVVTKVIFDTYQFYTRINKLSI